MRPINLIPEQERRDQGGAGRTGPLAFIVIAALLIALAGVVVLVLTNNQVSEREAEITSLQTRATAAKQRADRLASFTAFKEVKAQRVQTITELANNRFNWPRVLHELALVMPRWVVLTKIQGSSGQTEGSDGTAGLASSVKGPTLSIYGCAKSQTRTAQMVTALKRLDGVTRVGLSKSVLRFPGEDSGNSGSGSSEGENEGECLPGNFSFEAVAAFDGAPLPVESTEGVAAPAVSETESSESSEGESSETTASTETTSSGATTTTTTESIPPN